VPEARSPTSRRWPFRLGITSLRAPLQALALARASAALSGETEVGEPDLLTAVELVLAPRATQMPEAPAETRQNRPTRRRTTARTRRTTRQRGGHPPHPRRDDAGGRARHAAPDLLARMEAGRAARNAASAAGTGAAKKGNRRGRPLPSRAGGWGDARVDLVATLRAAAPWQPLRRKTTGRTTGLHVRMSDIRVRQFEERSDRAIIFVVDASGSAALARLAEAKGAIELLLGEAYARRDHVALVAFRGDGADILLPPTRSLVQTKRRLGQLPGGGGTPLASGLKAALELAAWRRARA
jgi:magnesium chelatase subunit D